MAEVAAAQTYQTATDGQQPQYAEATGTEDAMEVRLVGVMLQQQAKARDELWLLAESLVVPSFQHGHLE